ncbi:MAG: hypothetical protein ACI8ZM_000593 [Crocinitomix sp.]
MPLFNQIEKLGFKFENLSNLSEEYLISIEIKLNEKSATVDTFDKKDVLLFMYTLRKEKDNLETFFQDEYFGLRLILQYEYDLAYPPKPYAGELTFEDDFIRFLAVHFDVGLKESVKLCIRKENYYALHSLLSYNRVLSSNLLLFIRQKMAAEINVLIQAVIEDLAQFPLNIAVASVPDFFRCLNKLGGKYFESDIERLLQLILAENDNGEWCLQILYAIGTFKAENYETQKLLETNRKRAYKAGVREVSNPKDKINGRRGTKHKKPRRILAGFLLMPILIVCFIKIGTLIMFNLEPEIDYSVPNEMFSPPDIEGLFQGTDQTFVDNILFLHSGKADIFQETPIKFNIENTKLPTYQNTFDEDIEIEILNTSNKELVLIAQHFGKFSNLCYCVSPNQSITITTNLIGFRIYGGASPQIVDYIDLDGDTHSHFRFKTFTDEDERELKIYHHVNMLRTKGSKRQIIISNKGKGYQLKKLKL